MSSVRATYAYIIERLEERLENPSLSLEDRAELEQDIKTLTKLMEETT